MKEGLIQPNRNKISKSDKLVEVETKGDLEDAWPTVNRDLTI